MMKQETTDQKTGIKPIAAIIYPVFKKTLKYGFYIVLIYFAYEGFMAWE